MDEYKLERWQQYQDTKNQILTSHGFKFVNCPQFFAVWLMQFDRAGQQAEEGTDLDRKRMRAIILETCEQLAPQRKIELAIQEKELQRDLPPHTQKNQHWEGRGRHSPALYSFMS